MDVLILWERHQKRNAPVYPKAGIGHQSYPLMAILRVHCMQLFYSLSDPGMEGALHEIELMRVFVGLSLSRSIPDETTILNLRRLLEKHRLGGRILKEVNQHLEVQGLLLKGRRDYGCEHHLGDILNQECIGNQRPGDAPDAEGKSLLFRHEAAHWRG